MTRVARMLAVLDGYPEFVASGIALRRIVEECCKRIPTHGIEDGRTPEEVLEIASEFTLKAIGEDRLRGAGIARYLVATFKAIAADGVRNLPDGLSRVGLASELAEMRRLEAATMKARQEAAQRPLPDPALPARALARLPPRPDGETWLHGPTRPRLPPRRPDIESDRCEPLADLLPTETVRENRDATYENERVMAERAGKGAA